GVKGMGKSFGFRPQLEVLEGRLAPGDLRGGLRLIRAPGEVEGATAADQPGQDLILWDTRPALAAHGGEVLPAAATPHGFSLTEMARETASFITSGNHLSLYPNTPFHVRYY